MCVYMYGLGSMDSHVCSGSVEGKERERRYIRMYAVLVCRRAKGLKKQSAIRLRYRGRLLIFELNSQSNCTSPFRAAEAPC